MFKVYRQCLFACVIFFLAFLQTNCTQKKTPDVSNENDFSADKTIVDIITPTKDRGIFTTERSAMCASFHALLDDTLVKHLLRDQTDKDILLQHALSFLGTFPNQTEIDYESWAEFEEKKRLIELPQTEDEQCSIVETLAKTTTFNLNLSKDDDAKLIETYLTLYRYFLTFSDGGLSHIDYDKEETDSKKRLGLILVNRPEYSYPLNLDGQEHASVRNPNYLFIQSIHPKSVLNQHRQDLVGKYIVELCSSEENCLKINEQSLFTTLETVLDNDPETIFAKLYDPKNAVYESYVLPLEQLQKLYAYSYFYPSTQNEAPIFVLKIRSFRSEQLNEDLKHVLKTDIQHYIHQFGSYPKNIVLDLRNNPGGYLNLAKSLAEYFLPEKTLLSNLLSTISDGQMKLFKKNENAVTAVWNGKNFLYIPLLTKHDHRNSLFVKQPSNLIILLNRRSASTSEIFAAAMKDHQAAMIIGEQSFGKFIGQNSSDELFADIPLSRSLIQNYYFSPLGYSHFLTPQLLDKEHNNPFDHSDFTNIADYLSLVNFEDPSTPIAKNPGRFDLDITLETTPLLTTELIAQTRIDTLPSSCFIPQDFSQIVEENDCLLDISDVYFSQLVELQ